jgi:selenocysteine lyase/cysteine desulfurase
MICNRRKAIEFFSQIPNIRLLGSTSVERLSIFSFLIKHEQTGLYLHSNFVCSLLNDLFGVQTRAGCACAGPYAHYLLGMDQELAKAYEQVLVQDERIDRTHLRIRHDTSKAEIVRPGFVRLSLAYYISEQRVDFILEAVKFVCEHGWKFLPQYIFNLETGEFRHRNLQVLFYKSIILQII